MRLKFTSVPEPNLEPPEDTRKCVHRCRICDGEIREGDDYYDIEGFGPCCEECIKDAKRYDAELPDNSDALYEEARDRRWDD